MSSVPGEPYSGTFIFDLNHLRDVLVDLARGSMRGLRREQPGVDGVIEELESQIARHGAAAGISDSAYARFRQCTSHLRKIRAVKGPIEKLLEVIKESEALYEHERENTISQMADAVRSTAKRQAQPGITAPFEKLLRYNSQGAAKAAKTRRKNAAEAGGSPEEEAG